MDQRNHKMWDKVCKPHKYIHIYIQIYVDKGSRVKLKKEMIPIDGARVEFLTKIIFIANLKHLNLTSSI